MVNQSAYQLPRYRELYEQLRRHIEDGIYGPGDLLPSENELCAVNQVTRPTVRRALDLLANEGYIKKHQGLGSVVQNPPKGIGILSFSGTTSAIGKENLKTDAIVKPYVRPWPDHFIFDLTDIERESGCIYFERLRYVNDIPVFYDLSYLPNINLPRFTSRNLNNASLFDILREHYRIEIKGGMQYIEAIPATENCQRHLGVEPDRPILKLQRKLTTNRLDYYVYSILFCNTEEHSLYGEF
ncbi:MAG: GntR family transcriptional regulator [Bacteroides sp. SM1_62]|nr:MAG: GntR family transcriptional regulator [Bacteroides sp. SM1_62]